MQEDFGTAWKGIQDAIAAGDIGLALEVAWAGLRVVWLRGTQDIRLMWLDMSKYVQDTWLSVTGWLSKNMIDAVGGFKSIWNDFAAFIATTFENVGQSVYESINGMIVKAQKLFIDLGVVGDSPEEIAKAQAAADIKKAAIDTAEASWKQKRDAKFNASRDAIEAGRQSQQDALGKDIGGQQKALDEDMDRRRNAVKKDHSDAVSEKEAELKNAQAELAAAAAKAAEARRRGAGPKRGDLPGLPGLGLPDSASIAKATVGTFSAAGALALGQGGGGDSPVVRELKEHKNIQKNQLKEFERARIKLDKLDMAMRG
jgi:hypothetical protein